MKFRNIIFITAVTIPVAGLALGCSHKPFEDEHRIGHRAVVVVSDRDRGWLGISIDEVTPKLARKENLKVDAGVLVREVQEDSPAEKAGIKRGDVLTEYDGKKILDERDLIDEVRRTKPGTEVTISVNRNGDTRLLKATIDEARSSRSYSFRVPSPRIHVEPRRLMIHRESMTYGMSFEELNRQLGEYFGAPNGKGLLVKNVKSGSAAEKAGFKAGDVIVKIGTTDISEIEDFSYALRKFKDGEKAEVEVLRKGSTQKINLTVENSDRDLSDHHLYFDGNDIDLWSPEEGAEFKLEMKRFQQEMEKFKDELHDNMIDLKERILHETKKIQREITI